MAELNPSPGDRRHPLVVLPLGATVLAALALLPLPGSRVVASVAVGTMLLAIPWRLALVVRSWEWPADRAFVVGAGALVLVIAAGTVLSRVL